VVASTILGSPGFVAALSEKHVEQLNANRNVPAVRQLSGQLAVEEVVEAVKRVVGEDGGLWRKISIHLCHLYRG